MAAFLNKYGVARHIYIPLIKAGVNNHAVSADWTPAAGDVKISKDGGAAANVTNLPTALAMGNSTIWDFSLTATEMQAAQVMVTVADSVTKAVEDDGFIIETYGDASGLHAFDLDTATQGVNVTQWLGSAAATPTVAGVPEVDVTHWIGTAAATPTVAGVPEVDVTHINGGLTTGNNATLSLAQLNIVNSAGSAVVASSTGGNGDGITASGNGSGEGISATGGATGHGLQALGGATSGSGINAVAAASGRGIFAAGVGLPAIEGNITADITGSLSGSVGSVAANGITAASIATDAIDGDALAATALTEIKTQVTDALNVDTYAEVGQETPAATQTIRKMLGVLYKAWRNKSTQTATQYNLYNDDTTTVDQKATVSDDLTTFTRNEVATGP